MKSFFIVLTILFTTTACAEKSAPVEEFKSTVTPIVEVETPVIIKVVPDNNCVKKDKNGKCPPLPTGTKPTPKKKAEVK